MYIVLVGGPTNTGDTHMDASSEKFVNASQTETAYVITGVMVYAPDGKPCNADMGCSPDSLERAAEIFAARFSRSAPDHLFVGMIRFALRNEKTGEMRTADISVNGGVGDEMFLTVPTK